MVSFEKFEEMVKLMDKDGDGSVDKVRAVPPPPLSFNPPFSFPSDDALPFIPFVTGRVQDRVEIVDGSRHHRRRL